MLSNIRLKADQYAGNYAKMPKIPCG